MKPNDTQKIASPAGATQIGGFRSPDPVPRLRSLTAAIQDTGPAPLAAGADGASATGSASVRGRTTVLPPRHRGNVAAAAEVEPRFDHLRTLGEGAMGQVDLVRDNDIHRT